MDNVLEHDYLKSHQMLLKLVLLNFAVPMIFVQLMHNGTKPKDWSEEEKFGKWLYLLEWLSFVQFALLSCSLLLPKPTEKWIFFSQWNPELSYGLAWISQVVFPCAIILTAAVMLIYR